VSWPLTLAVVVLVGLFLYWLLITTEGTYLGARVVALLYDWVARRYDAMKRFDPRFEEVFLTRPALAALKGQPTPLVLDVATGTGRIPALLLAAPTFTGRLIGLDYSRKMLQEAARKVASYPGRVALVWRDAMELPFPNASFDLVTCLEALEFMPRPEQALAEAIRVIRPGGMLLVSRRRGWESRVMPGKSWSEYGFRDILSTLGLEEVQLVPWQADYDLAWGWKPVAGPAGSSGGPDRGGIDWQERLFRCPTCGARAWKRENSALRCLTCQRDYRVTADGIIEMA
jgi:ubiquinone/menaquinone biosynthesis C-methylase UbiE